MTVRIAILVLTLLCTTAFAQTPTIGVYREETGSNCRIDDRPGIVNAYVVVRSPIYVSAVRFSAPIPPCFHATWLGETSPLPLVIGESPTDVAISFNGCPPMPLHVLTISYMSNGTTPMCCDFPILPPAGEPIIEFADCDQNIVPGTGLVHTINTDQTCFCGSDPAPTAPADPSPSQGKYITTIAPRLSWSASDPLDDPLTFDIHLGTAPDPPLYASDVPDTTYTPILDYETDYYWRVVTKDPYGNAVYGPEWLFHTPITSSSRIIAGDGLSYCGGALGDTVAIPVRIAEAAMDIRAGGFDLQFDSARLTFIRAERGALTASWPAFSATATGDAIRLDAAGAVAIPRNGEGTFATFYFLTDCCGEATTSQFCPLNLAGDLRAQQPQCGQFVCGQYDHDGDIATDGFISPRDAQCTLDAYVSFPYPPANGCAGPGWDVRADVDCSGTVTPADALCIFESWLENGCAFCDGGAPSAPVMAAMPRDVHALEITRSNGLIRIQLGASSTLDIGAFGFDISLDGAQYVGFEKSGITRDFSEMRDGEIESGHVRLGGYRAASEGAPSGSAGLVTIVLREVPGKSPVVTLSRFVDDLSGTPDTIIRTGVGGGPLPLEPTLAQNHPNPFNPTTRIEFTLPGAGASVRLVVYDVEGRFVTELARGVYPAGEHVVMWDGTDAAGRSVSSGVYFYALRTDDTQLRRKMVLLK